MNKAEKIAEAGRKSISRFCIEECKSYCCRKGYLVMTKNQLDKVVGYKKEEYKEQIKQLDKNKFSLYMGKSDKPCPSLNKDFKCNIYKDPLRPKACHNFPIFLNHKDKKALFSPRCLAYQLGLLFPYSKKLQLQGYEIVKVGSIVGLTGLELPDKFIDEKIAKVKLAK